MVWIPEPALGELRSERDVMWVAEKLAAGAMALFPELPNYRDEALRLMEIGGRYPVRRLDYPEAYCIAVAGNRGFCRRTVQHTPRSSSTRGHACGGRWRYW